MRDRVPAILVFLKSLVACVCLFGSSLVRSPTLAELRPWPLIAVAAVALLAAMGSLRWRGWSRRTWTQRLDLVPFAVATSALIVAVFTEAQFHRARYAVLGASPEAIERVGRHIVVGYRDPAFVRDLVERRAIAGIFLTQRNVGRRDALTIAREIGEFQAIRQRQGLPPLWIATDQEGGIVSRLSPPLDRQPPLARVVQGSPDRNARQAAVTAYAMQQGRGLAAMGVNLNFAPVIDLDFGVRNPNDAFTRISERAISADPAVVSEVAGWYCDALAAQGVRCTLKHFPGLGRVHEDTHRSEASLTTARDVLERTDWVPFRHLIGRAGSLVMVGHARLAAIDAMQPVSTSRSVITGLIRGEWGYDGLVITDDMCMGAIATRRGGIEQASLDSLNAGVDLLLISWDGEQIYPVLAALLHAERTLDRETSLRSANRLRAGQTGLPAAPSIR